MDDTHKVRSYIYKLLKSIMAENQSNFKLQNNPLKIL